MRGPRSSTSERATEPSATLAEVERELDQALARLRAWDADDLLPSVQRPGELTVQLVDELAVRLRAGGKRLRPVFALWGWVAAGGPHANGGPPTNGGPTNGSRRTLVELAAALELLHLFALVQDDVMDRSDTRRGLPTMHVTAAGRHRANGGLGDPVLFGDSVATLLGDLALAEASMLVAAAPAAVRALWRLMVVELVHGQLWDLTQAASRERRIEVSTVIARLKTGRYTVTRPLQLGALAAGADPALVARLGSFGDRVGDAFAIRDDILGVWGDPAATGKPAGDDLRSAKPTVLLALAQQAAPADGQEIMRRCNAGTLDDAGVAELRERLVQWGVREQAEAQIDRLVRDADAILGTLDIDPQAAVALRALATTTAWRSS